MKTPSRLQTLVEDGLVDEVVSRLMSGKEADLYVVRCGAEYRCAKVYKDSAQRSFKAAVHYQQGRKVRNSRVARAMKKGSSFGRRQQDEKWQTAELNSLRLLAGAGVRVPRPYGCVDGVLLMELITDASGGVAPRLSDVSLTAEEAMRDHAVVMRYVVRMLCTGVVHGDLSEFNVLVDDQGPVIIDLPQAVDASANNQAQAMFERDVGNMTSYYARFAAELAECRYAKEIWSLFENGDLQPETPLSGHFEDDTTAPDVDAVLEEIKAVLAEERMRQEGLL